MKCLLRGFSVAAAALCLSLLASSATAEDQWVPLFDGKTMEGWEKVGSEQSVWEVKDGALCGSGPASMVVCTKGPYKNFRYRCEVKINDKGNSGLYFRTTRKPGFTDGYEAQIDSTHRDPIRTGSLYGMCHVYKRLVEPDVWFTYELAVRDDIWRGKPMTVSEWPLAPRGHAHEQPARRLRVAEPGALLVADGTHLVAIAGPVAHRAAGHAALAQIRLGRCDARHFAEVDFRRQAAAFAHFG